MVREKSLTRCIVSGSLIKRAVAMALYKLCQGFVRVSYEIKRLNAASIVCYVGR